ncbi:MAG: hypothetical protein GF355_01000 [Candidatus Eisenbacteria bacterium]|nr:hypothetical protein [Candidatus Eisenbacteria bacterium]
MWKSLCLMGLVAALVCTGCTDEETIVEPEELAPPLGLQSVTMDGGVRLSWWCSNYDDLDGFKIYMDQGTHAGDPRQSPPAGFSVVDSIEVEPPCGEGVMLEVSGLDNGTTYSFLVVAAKDDWRDISHTSNIIEDTPRQESATEMTLWDFDTQPESAGLELSDFAIVDCTTLDAQYNTDSGLGDIMCETFNPGAGTRAWIDGINGGQVQDLGFMSNWDNADMAPPEGYAAPGHSVEAIFGHVYAVRTGDGHYGKVQVLDIDPELQWIEVKAAFQPDQDNREYRRRP